jgi:hypothetical protein
MFCTVTGVAPGVGARSWNDQSLLGSHAPELVMRNWISRRDSDWPDGVMLVPEQLIVTK